MGDLAIFAYRKRPDGFKASGCVRGRPARRGAVISGLAETAAERKCRRTLRPAAAGLKIYCYEILPQPR
jgi:hypothetical protein